MRDSTLAPTGAASAAPGTSLAALQPAQAPRLEPLLVGTRSGIAIRLVINSATHERGLHKALHTPRPGHERSYENSVVLNTPDRSPSVGTTGNPGVMWRRLYRAREAGKNQPHRRLLGTASRPSRHKRWAVCTKGLAPHARNRQTSPKPTILAVQAALPKICRRRQARKTYVGMCSGARCCSWHMRRTCSGAALGRSPPAPALAAGQVPQRLCPRPRTWYSRPLLMQAMPSL